MNMFLETAGGHYVMHNLVTEFEKDRTIAWLPGQLDDAGKHDPGRLVRGATTWLPTATGPTSR